MCHLIVGLSLHLRIIVSLRSPHYACPEVIRVSAYVIDDVWVLLIGLPINMASNFSFELLLVTKFIIKNNY